MSPGKGFLRTIQQASHFFQILLRLVQQAVEADRGEMMGRTTEWSKAKGDVKARFAHGTVAFVIVRGEPHPIAVLTCRRLAIRHMDLGANSSSVVSVVSAVSVLHREVSGADARMRDQPPGNRCIVRGIIRDLRDRTSSNIEVAGQTGVSRQFGSSRPLRIVALRVAICPY